MVVPCHPPAAAAAVAVAAAVQARPELSELWVLLSAHPDLMAQLDDPDLYDTLFAPDNNAIRWVVGGQWAVGSGRVGVAIGSGTHSAEQAVGWVAPLAVAAGLGFGCSGGAAQSGACSLSQA